MGLEAATKALLDAGITYDAVEAAYVGFCYGDSTSGQVSGFVHAYLSPKLTLAFAESPVQSRHDGNTDHKREQQLFYGQHCTL